MLADRDMANLIGDFAFTVLPKIGPESTMGEEEMKKALNQLQELAWRLEDAIMECEPNDDFVVRFLTEKFC
mgnify:CR=1 FL=1